MATYIVFLRGINVSGKNKIKMSDLSILIQSLGFTQVSTYIQSGNIVLKGDQLSTAEVSQKIEDGIYDTFGFKIPTLVRTPIELKEIMEKSPFRNQGEVETKKWYYTLLYQFPSKELTSDLQQLQFPNERFTILRCCIYLSCDLGYGKAKYNNTFFEKKLKVTATTRNHSTMMKLWEMAEEN